ncbi:hypothetical protein NDU88_000288 [Pleurodeles waltl]|uniref:Uncharacterized protein n=1 Tax=Pleurodeles waltl TaxID=8319 RepID=A0AAV7KLU2_PLEWA|nr:hypothetical protein NDU88_000288 [Pleurodeles waltl]
MHIWPFDTAARLSAVLADNGVVRLREIRIQAQPNARGPHQFPERTALLSPAHSVYSSAEARFVPLCLRLLGCMFPILGAAARATPVPHRHRLAAKKRHAGSPPTTQPVGSAHLKSEW